MTLTLTPGGFTVRCDSVHSLEATVEISYEQLTAALQTVCNTHTDLAIEMNLSVGYNHVDIQL